MRWRETPEVKPGEDYGVGVKPPGDDSTGEYLLLRIQGLGEGAEQSLTGGGRRRLEAWVLAATSVFRQQAERHLAGASPCEDSTTAWDVNGKQAGFRGGSGSSPTDPEVRGEPRPGRWYLVRHFQAPQMGLAHP